MPYVAAVGSGVAPMRQLLFDALTELGVVKEDQKDDMKKRMVYDTFELSMGTATGTVDPERLVEAWRDSQAWQRLCGTRILSGMKVVLTDKQTFAL